MSPTRPTSSKTSLGFSFSSGAEFGLLYAGLRGHSQNGQA
jgi:hypothetical protein